MIIVKGRELLIPENDRYIGTNYDTGMENRVFRIPRLSQSGTDLSDLKFNVNLIFNSEPLDIAELQKSVDDDYIYLTWTVTAAQVAVTGTVFVCVTGNDTNDTVKWSSFMAPFYTEKSLGEDVESEYKRVIAKINGEITERKAADDAEKAERQSAISAEIAARQSADAIIESEISAIHTTLASETSSRAAEDANLQNQINQILAPSGEAPSAAEVENARIASDGTVYATLGEAIRTQVSDIADSFSDHVLVSDPNYVEQLNIVPDTESLSYYTISYFHLQNSAVWRSDSLYGGVLIPRASLEKFDGIEFYAEANPIEAAFLKDNNITAGSAPNVCDGTKIIRVKTIGSVVVSKIPSDCEYLYIYISRPGYPYKDGIKVYGLLKHEYSYIDYPDMLQDNVAKIYKEYGFKRASFDTGNAAAKVANHRLLTKDIVYNPSSSVISLSDYTNYNLIVCVFDANRTFSNRIVCTTDGSSARVNKGSGFLIEIAKKNETKIRTAIIPIEVISLLNVRCADVEMVDEVPFYYRRLELRRFKIVNFNLENGDTWTANSDYNGVIIPRAVLGNNVVFDANDYKIVAVFLKNDDITVSTLPNWCDNTGTIRINAGEKATHKVPVDCGYLYVYLSNRTIFERLSVYTDSEMFAEDQVRKIPALKKSFHNLFTKEVSQDLYVLAHISDIHRDRTRFRNFAAFCKVHSDIIDNAICTGDYTVNADINELTPMVAQYSGLYDIIPVVGNHDKSAFGYSMTDDQLKTALGLTSLYYSRSLTDELTLICLDQYDTSVSDCRDHDVHYSQNQINWFVQQLKDAATNQKAVIIAMHRPESFPASNNLKFYQRAIANHTTYYCSGTPIEDIVDAWVNGSSINQTYIFSDTNDSITVNTTFNTAGTFVAYLCGHFHQDCIGYSAAHSGQLYLLITCGATTPWGLGTYTKNYGQEFSDLPRIENTYTENAFNIYGIDLKDHKVKVLRIGSDTNDLMQKRDMESYGF